MRGSGMHTPLYGVRNCVASKYPVAAIQCRTKSLTQNTRSTALVKGLAAHRFHSGARRAFWS